ncbi:Fic family protein [Salinibacterium soli]|uniref:Fic family protein n=1 Tax=Antiquaquibacter soli TaxID=3064523 RepID=A0ABT9BJU3_9MICO|nr:Fic family protein [Protaetiibacter sp. WY-16]MDO7880824.1 Fic family protein [Protaetiibacter sp. WY-16]
MDWPSIGAEKLEWLEPPGWGATAARNEHFVRYYDAAVPPFIAGLSPRAQPDTAALAELAAHELGRFDAELGDRVAAFAPVLLRSESASSSQIENLTASARAIFSAELGARTGRNAEEIVGNTRAMQAAVALADDISAESILEMHRTLMSGQSRHTPGEWRDEPVWIGTRSDSPVGAEYVAPDHHRVPELIDDLVAFSRRLDLPPLTHVAVAHAQFETIHPFSDGNGRTGRALAQSLLRHRGVTRNVAVPVSAGLLADVEGYHRALTSYREGDLDPLVTAFANAALRAVANARILVDELTSIRTEWDDRLTVRRSSNAWRLLDVVARRPVLDAASAAAELGVSVPNVYPPLATLTDAGILAAKSEHRLGPFWRSNEILDAVDRFAERAGRRQL